MSVVYSEESWGKCCLCVAAAAAVTAGSSSWEPCPVYFIKSPLSELTAPVCVWVRVCASRHHWSNMWSSGLMLWTVMQDSHCSCTGWLLIWNTWIMDRMWICCQILLLLGVAVNSSPRDGDEASCDGAFDIYFVLDRWADTHSFCLC